jgi:cation transport ATPase
MRTGALTEGRPAVREITSLVGEEDLLAAAAAAESSSEHPLATTGLVYLVWAMVAMALSVTTIFINSIGGRPRLLFEAIGSVGRTHERDPGPEPAGRSG